MIVEPKVYARKDRHFIYPVCVTERNNVFAVTFSAADFCTILYGDDWRNHPTVRAKNMEAVFAERDVWLEELDALYKERLPLRSGNGGAGIHYRIEFDLPQFVAFKLTYPSLFVEDDA